MAACRSTEKRVDGKCVGVSIHCLPGHHQVGLKCVRNAVIADRCKRDEQRIDGRCVHKPSIIVDCKRGYHLVGNACVKKPVIVTACRATEKLLRGHCVPKHPVKKLNLQKVKQASGKVLPPRPARPRHPVN